MPRNGSGSYSRAEDDYVAGTAISETAVNSELDDIATALTASLAKDGQTSPSANLPMATYRHTGVGNGAARTDYAAVGQVQDGSLVTATDTGTADTYAIALTPVITAYATGQRFVFKAVNASTGSSTLNVNGLGAKTIKKLHDQNIAAGDIEAGQIVEVLYDGTNLQMQTPAATGHATGALAALDTVGTAQIDNNAVDETKLKDALIADFTEVTAVAGDSILLGDASDSGNTKRDTIQGILDLITTIAAPGYTSAETTVAADTAQTFAHSLGAVPSLVRVVLRCKTDDQGYSSSNSEEVDATTLTKGGSSEDSGIIVSADATNITVTTGVNIRILNKSTFNDGAITEARWKWIVRAWA